MEIEILETLARGYEKGRNPIEDPSTEGGIFVNDETIALAAKMESVLDMFKARGEKQQFFTDLLQVLNDPDPDKEGLDPVEVVETWLDAWLETS